LSKKRNEKIVSVELLGKLRYHHLNCSAFLAAVTGAHVLVASPHVVVLPHQTHLGVDSAKESALPRARPYLVSRVSRQRNQVQAAMRAQKPLGRWGRLWRKPACAIGQFKFTNFFCDIAVPTPER
jgi:hypothetical protein